MSGRFREKSAFLDVDHDGDLDIVTSLKTKEFGSGNESTEYCWAQLEQNERR